MWIYRDILTSFDVLTGLPAKLLQGMRQVGKTSLLEELTKNTACKASLDLLPIRELASSNPELFFKNFTPPVFIDEVQYAPELFPQMKYLIDEERKKRRNLKSNLTIIPMFYLTGSNYSELDKNIKETLAGRIERYTLHTLSVHEIQITIPDYYIGDLFLKGGWPELWVDTNLSIPHYINEFIQSFIEKDIARSYGIEKISSFLKALRLMAARAAQIMINSDIAKSCEVSAPTISDWLSLLEKNHVVTLLKPFESNLNKRLVKSPKIFINDCGLATRLQGWTNYLQLSESSQFGHLFENLVFTEILKTRDHYRKNWEIFFWRTKDGEEVDFLVQNESGKIIALDAKVKFENINPHSLFKTLPAVKNIFIVTLTGQELQRSESNFQVPIEKLCDLLLREL